MPTKKNLLLSGFISLLMLVSFSAFSQSKEAVTERRNELGIDITNTLTFLKRNNQSYLINYRYFFAKGKYAMRGGLNLDLSNDDADGYYPDIKIGFQKNKSDEKWMRYYGVDASFSYFKSNATPVAAMRYGLSPLVGVSYFFSKKISFSTEAAINFNHYITTTQNSFAPNVKATANRVNIGYIGMFVVSYHF